MGIRLHTILSVTLLAVSVGAVVGIPSHVTAANADAITASDVVYTPQEMFDFSIQGYLAKRAPHLSRQAEAISHWAGYSDISPKVLIALMEQESGSVSRKRRYPRAALLRPFGDLSPKIGFNAQLQDVAERLTAIVLSQREMALSGKAGFVPVDPIQALYAQSGRSTNAAAFAGRVQFASTYAGLFNEIWGSAVKPDVLKRDITKAIPSSTLLQLPYSNGESRRTGFPHSNSGAGTIMSSLDFAITPSATSDKIRASADGTVVIHSNCHMEIIHSNGWSTKYFHLENIRFPANANVYKGDWIASPAKTQAQALCTPGAWTGPHLHWTLKKDGVESSLKGVTVSGYVMTVNSTKNYDTVCEPTNYLTKNAVTYCFNESIKNTH